MILAEAGTDFNATLDASGWTAAHYAALSGQVGVLKFLHEARRLSELLRFQRLVKRCEASPPCEEGANLDAKDNSGQTPAFLAAQDSRVNSLQVLAEARAAVCSAR